MGPRWRKVLRDLTGNRVRTALVLLSITVGVFAVGFVAGARVIILRSLVESVAAVNPASATLTAEPFGEELVRAVGGLPAIREAEGRRTITVRLNVGPDEWRDLELFAIPDYDRIRINKLRPERGAW